MDNACEPRSIKELFLQDKTIKIQPYQRAYSWEVRHWKQFIDDIQFIADMEDTIGKNYHLGQFIFEEAGDTLDIIDGQQRLTTIVLFFAALAKVIKQEKHEEDEEYKRIKKIFLSGKLRTIDIDQEVFTTITNELKPVSPDSVKTPSQRQLIDGFSFFSKKLKQKKFDAVKRGAIQETLEKAVIGTFYIKTKVEAAQVFEYQNNRGINLTEFDKIKAYLMYQIYLINKDSETFDKYISDIQDKVSKIYRIEEFVKPHFSIDDLLNCFCWLNYSHAGSLDEVKKRIKKYKVSTEAEKEESFEDDDGNYDDSGLHDDNEMLKWVKKFFNGLLVICQSAENIVDNIPNQPLIYNLFLVSDRLYWDYVLIAIWTKGGHKNAKIDKILKLFEICWIKLGLIRIIESKKKDFLYDEIADPFYKGEMNFNDMIEKLKNISDNVKGWENFDNMLEKYKKQHNQFDRYKEQTKYILWQYENHLRARKKMNRLPIKDYANYTIEHICPQENDKGKPFNEKNLHCIGNLALLLKSDNSSLKDNPFEKKKKKYTEYCNNDQIISYKKIIEKTDWRQTEIQERKNVIYKFIDKYFTFKAR
jgi:hypothetical protein